MSFETFNFHPSIMAGVKALGYITPTPIQRKSIPPIMQGRDFIGLAQTDPHVAGFVPDDDECGETEAAATLDHLRDAVDVNDAFLQFFFVQMIECHRCSSRELVDVTDRLAIRRFAEAVLRT